MRASPRSLVFTVFAVLVTGWTASASAAEVFDHLQCFRIKDLLEKTTYTADLTAADPIFVAAERGCEIQMPARMLCVDARKTSVEPAPPGAPDGLQAQKYLCYRAKCGRTRPSTVLEDQFGTHLFSINSTSMICAPVTDSGGATTTTLPPCRDADEDGWTECNGDCDDGDPMVNPDQPELCDGIDNDCDSLVDAEDAENLVGVGEPCGLDFPGVCSEGITVCEGGGLLCRGLIDPGTLDEVCNGLDDDCNGMIDETDPNLGLACETGLPGQCAPGYFICWSAELMCQQNQPAEDEICLDGVDNDCDGAIDEGPTVGDPCYTGLPGQCSTGETVCEAGNLQCVPSVAPGPEVCDGIDNDCDGMIDNGVCMPDGSHCILKGECASQMCVDGVCCNLQCDGNCEACSAVKKGYGQDGTCEDIAFGLDPDDECGPFAVCDGAGTCTVAP